MTLSQKTVVLSLEENTALLTVEQEILSGMGYELVGAQTFGQAIALAKNTHIDLFLIDFMSSNYFDETQMRILKATNPQAATILISSIGQQPVPTDWSDCPFVEKPINIGDLEKIIQDMLISTTK